MSFGGGFGELGVLDDFYSVPGIVLPSVIPPGKEIPKKFLRKEKY